MKRIVGTRVVGVDGGGPDLRDLAQAMRSIHNMVALSVHHFPPFRQSDRRRKGDHTPALPAEYIDDNLIITHNTLGNMGQNAQILPAKTAHRGW